MGTWRFAHPTGWSVVGVMGTLRFAHPTVLACRMGKGYKAVPINPRTQPIKEDRMEFRRARIPGGTYFFTVVAAERRPLLIDNASRLREAFRSVKHRYPFHIEAIVVLPDHLHAIWRLPDGDADYPLRWSLIKRHFSIGLPAGWRTASRRSKREKGIWQRRYWEHCIRDENDLHRHLDYIHYNPAKHGFVNRVADWIGRTVPLGSGWRRGCIPRIGVVKCRRQWRGWSWSDAGLDGHAALCPSHAGSGL